MANPLYAVPGLGGYIGAGDVDQSRLMGMLQQMGLAQGLMAKQQAAQQEQAFRQEISQAQTPEEKLAVASKYMGPDALGKMVQGSQDRQAQIKATKEATMARLTQAAKQHEMDYNIKKQNAKTNEERLALDTWDKQVKNLLNETARRQAGETLFYETGVRVGMPELPQQPAISNTGNAAPAPVAPAGGVQFNVEGVQGTMPDEATAMRVAQFLRGGGQTPAPAPAPQPAPPTPAPSPVATPAAPNNLDARDLALRNMQQPQALTPPGPPAPVTPTPLAAPVMPDWVKQRPQKFQDAWLKEQSKASIAGAGRLTKDSLTMVAEQYLAGDRQAIQGYARDQATKSALQNRITELAKERGMKGQDLAAQMADFAGIVAGSRTVGQRAAQISLAATEAEKMIDVAEEQSKKFDRTQFPPINAAIKAYESNTGDPNVRAFGAAINTLVNIYARAISPSGVATVSDKDHARELLRVVDSPEQFAAVIKVMRAEMKAAKEAPGEVREATRRSVTGAPAETAPAVWDADKERRYQEWKARQR